MDDGDLVFPLSLSKKSKKEDLRVIPPICRIADFCAQSCEQLCHKRVTIVDKTVTQMCKCVKKCETVCYKPSKTVKKSMSFCVTKCVTLRNL